MYLKSVNITKLIESEKMKKKDEVWISIGEIFVRFVCPSKWIKYLMAEYENISIMPKNVLPEITVMIQDGQHSKYDYVLKARLRHCYVSALKNRAISFNIPRYYAKSYWFKIISPFYEERSQACLTDFLHGIFLGVLQDKMLNIGQSLLHASAIVDAENKAYVFIGSEQVGKSTICSLLSKSLKYKVLAEDFCVINDAKQVYALPHRARVAYSETTDKVGFFEKINLWLTKITSSEVLRRKTFNEMFGDCHETAKTGIEMIYILQRTGDKIGVADISTEYFSEFVSEVMASEIRNFAGLKDYCEWNRAYRVPSIQKIITDTTNVIKKLYSESSCKLISIPYYDSIEELEYELCKFFTGGNA